jgi:hypothetical protein
MMMKKVLYAPSEVATMITAGKTLILAGESKLLKQLPPGNWIGGTIPYFMTESGGTISQEQIYVTELPAAVTDCAIKTYTTANLANVYQDPSSNGFSVIIIPSGSPVHVDFALHAPGYDLFATRPLVGWISGTHLDDIGRVPPEVFCGLNPQPLTDAAVVMHVGLPDNTYANLKIVNIFAPGTGDTITFSASGMSATSAMINGAKQNFAAYLQANNIDTKMPLVANYNGAMINTSFQAVDPVTQTVKFYAPVFEGVEYKLAKPITDYVNSFNRQLPRDDVDAIFFSCNCILNFLYSDLEGKQTGGVTGPITFGEIAYQLLNQTMVYLMISKI